MQNDGTFASTEPTATESTLDGRSRFHAAFRRWRGGIAAGLLFALGIALATATGSSIFADDNDQKEAIRNLQPFPDPAGEFRTLITNADHIDTKNPFFQDLGTNGRRCVTCHQASDAWSVTPPHIRERFEETQGFDPIFRTNDGSNCPGADISTLEDRREAFSMLLNKGLIRVSLGVPAGAEFSVIDVDNPYAPPNDPQGCSSLAQLGLFRRPLPSTNLGFLSTVMWDGRETFKDPTTGKPLSLTFDFEHQAMDATLGHAQAAQAPTADQINQIVAFETSLVTAQTRDHHAGSLESDGAHGGPVALSQQPFFLGINDVLGGNPTGAPFSPLIFDLYKHWNKIRDDDFDERTEARRAVARGEELFNTLPIRISGVKGLNDNPAVGDPFMGTCGTCHDTPNVGNHSLSAPLNIGLTDESRRTPDLPLYTLRNNTTLEIVKTTDPGRAMISGKWADIGKFKGPILRGLAARAPYFHNGSAATLLDAVNFYDTRFSLHLTEHQKSDLVAFLKTL